MPFFIRGHGKQTPNKKKLVKGKGGYSRPNGIPQSKKLKKDVEHEEDIITSEEDEEVNNKIEDRPKHEIDLYEEETAQEKKVRLAHKYLEELRNQQRENDDEEAIRTSVGLKLREDVLEAAGQLKKSVADLLEEPNSESVQYFRSKHHKLSLTCAVVSNDESLVFSSSKDASIVKWSINGEKKGVILSNAKQPESAIGHSSNILSLALSSDNKFLASGDEDGLIHIWDPENLKHLKTFKKHRGPISGLVFRKGTHTLYSASHDRLVMSWNCDVLSFAESLGGHQDCITGIDALHRESCVTSGGRDEMVIVYVIPEEKQLRFSASQSSIDGVKLVNEKTFITYGQNGSIALWTTLKKKPHFVISAAHGLNSESGEPNWVTSVAALVNTDLIASGSLDKVIRLWKIDHRKRKMEALFTIPIEGIVNSLEFTHSGSHLVASVGKEHKLGRWYNEKAAKNSLVIISLNQKAQLADSLENEPNDIS